MTRRGTLSVLSSVYDPLGFGAPFLLKGKQILKKLYEQGLKWDEELPKETAAERSEAVLGYISNQSRKFEVFVTNRVEIIQENSCDSHWFYVNTGTNPADYCTREIDANNTKVAEACFNGPSFLWESQST